MMNSLNAGKLRFLIWNQAERLGAIGSGIDLKKGAGENLGLHCEQLNFELSAPSRYHTNGGGNLTCL